MIDLPLFPLGTVLYPGMPLSLHIFEPRYKEMIEYCITEDRPFGVVLIEKGQEVGAPAQPHMIGCTANISQTQPLKDGRMNLVAIGGERFHIKSLDYSRSYLMGTVNLVPLAREYFESTHTLIPRLRHSLLEYLNVLSNVGEVDFNTDKLPDDPVDLAYLTATLLQVPANNKQSILELESDTALMDYVYRLCRREIPLLRQMISPPIEPSSEGMFSLN